MARKLIKKPQGLYTMSLLNTDNKVDLLIKTFVHRKITLKTVRFDHFLWSFSTVSLQITYKDVQK